MIDKLTYDILNKIIIQLNKPDNKIIIDKLTSDILNKIIIQLNKPNNKIKLENEIVTPLLCNIYNKLYPYVSLLFIMYIINLILILVILVLLILYNK